MTEQFRPELFDDSGYNWHIVESGVKHHQTKPTKLVVIGRLFLLVFTYMFLWLT
jgi:hypothetical protein